MLLKEFPFVQCDRKNKLILVYDKGVYYYLDYSLNKISKKFKCIKPFDNYGYSVVQLIDTSYVAVLTTNMEYLFKPVKANKVVPLSKDYFKIISDVIEIIDKTGKTVISGTYDDISYEQSGYFKTKYLGRYGLKDKNNKTIFEPIYNQIIDTKDKFIALDYKNLDIKKEYMK